MKFLHEIIRELFAKFFSVCRLIARALFWSSVLEQCFGAVFLRFANVTWSRCMESVAAERSIPV